MHEQVAKTRRELASATIDMQGAPEGQNSMQPYVPQVDTITSSKRAWSM